jgi:hypothetical protein
MIAGALMGFSSVFLGSSTLPNGCERAIKVGGILLSVSP